MGETLTIKELLKLEKEESKCKGVFWRGWVSTYLSQYKSVEVRKSLRLLKRKSCPGCEKCEWIWDFINEEIYGGDMYCSDLLSNIENGKTYTYKIDGGWDWETGIWEIDGFYFKEVE